MSLKPEAKFDEFLDEQFFNFKVSIQERHQDELSRARTMAGALARGKCSAISFSEDVLNEIDDLPNSVHAVSAPTKHRSKVDAVPSWQSHIVETIRKEFQGYAATVHEVLDGLKNFGLVQADIEGLRVELARFHEVAQNRDNVAYTSEVPVLPKLYASPLVEAMPGHSQKLESRIQSRRPSDVSKLVVSSPLVDGMSRCTSRRPSQESLFGPRLTGGVVSSSSMKPFTKPRSRSKFSCTPQPPTPQLSNGAEELPISTLTKRLSLLAEADGSENPSIYGISSGELSRSTGAASMPGSAPTQVTTTNPEQARKQLPTVSSPPLDDDLLCASSSTASFETSSTWRPQGPQGPQATPNLRTMRTALWDTDFALLEGWACGDEKDVKASVSQDMAMIWEFHADSEAPLYRSFSESAWCGLRTIQPKGLFKVAWDLWSVLLVGYDAFVLPLYFLDLEDVTFIIVMSWITRFFWTFDMAISCLTGYTRDDGNLEMRPRYICQRYCRTWFALDLALVTMDWAQEVLSELVSAAGRVGKFGRIARLIRLVRLIRIMRIVQVLGVIFENLDLSEKLSILANITFSLMAIAALMHLIGCIWYGLGETSSDGWVKSHHVQDEPFWTRYGRTLFWAAGLFTGNLDPVPYTGEERTFITLIMFFFFVVVTSFISTFTSSITQFMVLHNSRNAQFTVLRRYMKQHGISQRLCLRVTRNARHILDEKQMKTPEDEVDLLKVISEPLRRDLDHEIYAKVLATHPLFHHYNIATVPDMKKICHSALRFYNFSQSDILFSPGEVPPCQILMLHDGECQYTFGDFTITGSSEDTGLPVTAGQWICEPALWTAWTYRGLLRASADCQVMVVSGEKLMEINAQSQLFDLSSYGHLYVEHLNKGGSACTDLAYAIEIDDIVEKAYTREPKDTKTVSMRVASQRGSMLSMSALFPSGR